MFRPKGGTGGAAVRLNLFEMTGNLRRIRSRRHISEICSYFLVTVLLKV